MLCKRGLCCQAVCVCLSVTFVHSVKTNKRIFTIGYPHHSSFSVPNGMAIFRRECRWVGRNRDSEPAAGAIHLAATEHGDFIRLVADERPSLLMVGNNDDVYDKKP